MTDRHEEDQNSNQVRTPGVAFEKRDASFRGVISFAIGLAIAAAIIQLIVWGMLRYFDKIRAEGAVATHAPLGGPYEPPPGPRLQADPVLDMNKFRASEERILNSYTWADGQHTAVRIPIEQAKQMLLQKGLPVVNIEGPPVPLQVRPPGPSPARASQVAASSR